MHVPAGGMLEFLGMSALFGEERYCYEMCMVG